jgi:hypothetical protein
VQHKNVFLLDTCFWLISAIIIYLIYPIIYCIIWAMNIDDRMKNLSKEELISLIKEIKITCESNRFSKTVISANSTFNFILRLIKGEL